MLGIEPKQPRYSLRGQYIYTQDTFGRSWRSSRVYGTIRVATGWHEWAVDFVDGTEFTCTSRQLRREVQWPTIEAPQVCNACAI